MGMLCLHLFHPPLPILPFLHLDREPAFLFPWKLASRLELTTREPRSVDLSGGATAEEGEAFATSIGMKVDEEEADRSEALDGEGQSDRAELETKKSGQQVEREGGKYETYPDERLDLTRQALSRGIRFSCRHADIPRFF
jgi:hypothetical protein